MSVSKYRGPNNVFLPIIGRLANGFAELNAVLNIEVPEIPKMPPGLRKFSFELESGFTPGEPAANAAGRGSQKLFVVVPCMQPNSLGVQGYPVL